MSSRKPKLTAKSKDDATLARPESQPEPAWTRTALTSLALVSVLLFALRLGAAYVVGFGDSEALYATWALHPQAAYLDHPGLISLVARALGGGTVPAPWPTHVATSVFATLIPWLMFAAARVAGAGRGGAALAALVIAVVPETAVGLFALTPDLLLAPAWIGTLALVCLGMREPAHSNRSAAAFLAAGLLSGIACTAKVSGLLLLAALGATYVSLALTASSKLEEAPEWLRARASVRTLWPWAGMAAGALALAPVVFFEANSGWPMLQHRFIDTQAGAGIALRNIATLFGGQLLYLSPLFALFAVWTARDLYRRRHHDPISRFLFLSFAIPVVPLLGLCLWSPVAEPHWMAPSLLALPLHASRRLGAAAVTSRRGIVAALSLATALTLFTHAWVLIPSSARLLPATMDPKFNISNELYGWPAATQAIKEQLASLGTPFDPEGHEVIVVGPHWTVCAQLHAALPGVRVGCASPMKDDFDGWVARSQWRHASQVLFVTDNRFPTDGASELPELVRTAQSRVRLLRGGRTARIFEFFLYDRRAQGAL